MGSDIGDGIEGEVTRVEAVTYLQGALGHALASSALLLVAAVVLAVGYRMLGWSLVVFAGLVSANGVSVWAWERLQVYFAPPADSDAEPTRRLTASPLSTDSIVEMKAGAVMMLVFVAVLLVGRMAFQYLDPQVVGLTTAVSLAIGNGTALVRAVRD